MKVIAVEAAGLRLANLLKEAGLAASTSEANRKIEEGAVKIDGVRVGDRSLTLQGRCRTRIPGRGQALRPAQARAQGLDSRSQALRRGLRPGLRRA